MKLLSGAYVTQEHWEQPTLEDLGIGLGRELRFGGQTIITWSVAEHLLACARYVRTMLGLRLGEFTRIELPVLVHDAHEAFTRDIPTCFKTPDMKQLQSMLDDKLWKGWGLPTPSVDILRAVKLVDREMLLAEAYVVAPRATYNKIREEVGASALHTAIRVVHEVLHDDVAYPGEVWAQAVQTQLNDRRNF